MENDNQDRKDEMQNTASIEPDSGGSVTETPDMIDSQVLSDMQASKSLEEAKKKKHKRTIRIIVAAIIVVLLLCAVAVGWYLWGLSQMTIVEVVD